MQGLNPLTVEIGEGYGTKAGLRLESCVAAAGCPIYLRVLKKCLCLLASHYAAMELLITLRQHGTFFNSSTDVSCEFDKFRVDAHLRKLRGTSAARF